MIIYRGARFVYASFIFFPILRAPVFRLFFFTANQALSEYLPSLIGCAFAIIFHYNYPTAYDTKLLVEYYQLLAGRHCSNHNSWFWQDNLAPTRLRRERTNEHTCLLWTHSIENGAESYTKVYASLTYSVPSDNTITYWINYLCYE